MRRLVGVSCIAALLMASACSSDDDERGGAADPRAGPPTEPATEPATPPTTVSSRPAGPAAHLAEELAGGQGVFVGEANPPRPPCAPTSTRGCSRWRPKAT